MQIIYEIQVGQTGNIFTIKKITKAPEELITPAVLMALDTLHTETITELMKGTQQVNQMKQIPNNS